MRTPASFILLTRGDRPEALAHALGSISRQEGIAAETVVVSNGAGEIDVPEDCRLIVSRENLGIPGGRNLGAANTTHPVMFFLDDDAWYADSDLASQALAEFAADPALGIVSFRIADPVTGLSERRHIPRLGRRRPERSSPVTSFLGGGCAIRREVFEKCGAYPTPFFYSHEESDLAWRALDAGFTILYRGDLRVLHPGARPELHSDYHFRSARNRVWLARRRLPWPLTIVHVAIWTLRSAFRAGSSTNRRQVWLGFRAGWTENPGERAPIGWSTVWRMTRLGRPPIV